MWILPLSYPVSYSLVNFHSTGEKNRIQVSPTTAEILRNRGKAHWLSMRDGLVSAKGKESMQTYWLSPPRTGSVAESTTSSGVGAPPVQLNAMRKYLNENLNSSGHAGGSQS